MLPDVTDGTAFDPLAPELFQAYWLTMAALRARDTALRSEANDGFVVLSRYADVRAATGDWSTFSSARGTAPAPIANQRIRFVPLDMDPPDHRAFRNILNPAFTKAAAEEAEPVVRGLARELIGDFLDEGTCELVSAFAEPLTARVVGEAVLGVPRDELARIMGWIDAITSDPVAAGAVYDEYARWAEKLIRSRRSGDGDDVLSVLGRAEVGGCPISHDDQLGATSVLVIAALDTTMSAIANIFHRLAIAPDLAERLRGAEVEVIDAAVEEFLRLDPPTPAMARTATRSVALHDTTIEEGEKALLYFSAANRDPDQFDDPDDFRLDRGRCPHLSFGFGPHLCIGRHIARVELRVAIQEILAAVDDLRLAVPADQVRLKRCMQLRPETLPLTFTRR